MLVITRREDEKVWIGDDIFVMVVRSENGQARLGIEAPRHILILRDEIKDRPRREERDH